MFHMLASFGIVRFLDFSHYNRYVVKFHCCFIVLFPNDIMLTFFSCVYLPFVYHLWRSAYLGLLPIFNWVVHFLTVEFQEIFVCFG